MAACKSRPGTRSVTLSIALLGTLLAALATPAPAAAHGPVNPAATSYLATVRRAPAGIEAKVVDGDQRMWLQAGRAETAVVLDYRGAPYLRFSPAGVQVNTNSSMYYLNQVPAELVPSNIGPRTPPHWSQVTSGHAYQWHDGRLHALAATARRNSTLFCSITAAPEFWPIPSHARRSTVSAAPPASTTARSMPPWAATPMAGSIPGRWARC